MKRIIALLVIVFTASSFNNPNEGELQWVDFNQGYEIAKKKNKIMLIDVYTDWCGWCKRMDRDTYAKPGIVGLINQDFVAIKFNPEIKNVTYKYEGKTYNGEELAGVISNYQISGYPTTIFMYPKDKKMNVVGGYHDEKGFKSILEDIKVEFKAAKTKPAPAKK